MSFSIVLSVSYTQSKYTICIYIYIILYSGVYAQHCVLIIVRHAYICLQESKSGTWFDGGRSSSSVLGGVVIGGEGEGVKSSSSSSLAAPELMRASSAPPAFHASSHGRHIHSNSGGSSSSIGGRGGDVGGRSSPPLPTLGEVSPVREASGGGVAGLGKATVAAAVAGIAAMEDGGEFWFGGGGVGGCCGYHCNGFGCVI